MDYKKAWEELRDKYVGGRFTENREKYFKFDKNNMHGLAGVCKIRWDIFRDMLLEMTRIEKEGEDV